ncbi:hypothetical protein [Asticcacaulis sp. AC402]|uniref:hypothetical protein n=1 Tax=Asticcacaulis sp. AC402 TaxID=1282361 RepID=UPI0003C3EB9C|nr:hypothetical protein [Asticcacaulis sp. AC402]ESQ74539.1 hypothetical protein ABAC402_13710 [Asticcacaulis sp. AC402]
MDKPVNPEQIAADILAWRERSDRMIATAAHTDVSLGTTHQTVRLTPDKRRLSDMFRKKTPAFEVSAATINQALDSVRKGRSVRSHISDLPENYAGGGRMDVLRPRKDRYQD